MTDFDHLVRPRLVALDCTQVAINRLAHEYRTMTESVNDGGPEWREAGDAYVRDEVEKLRARVDALTGQAATTTAWAKARIAAWGVAMGERFPAGKKAGVLQ